MLICSNSCIAYFGWNDALDHSAIEFAGYNNSFRGSWVGFYLLSQLLIEVV